MKVELVALFLFQNLGMDIGVNFFLVKLNRRHAMNFTKMQIAHSIIFFFFIQEEKRKSERKT